MKKFIAIPVLAVVAAFAAASAANFSGGVSAGPIQSGDAKDLTCATSATVLEWGTNDINLQGDNSTPPNVVNARIQLNDAHCSGQALYVLAFNKDGKLAQRATTGRIANQPEGVQYARVVFPAPINVSDLSSVRITIDPGWATLTDVLPIS